MGGFARGCIKEDVDWQIGTARSAGTVRAVRMTLRPVKGHGGSRNCITFYTRRTQSLTRPSMQILYQQK